MKYFKDKNNQVYAFEANGSQDAYIPENLIAITEIEADELRKPAPITLEEQAELVRFALQTSIDERAKSYGFSSGNALMLYAGFANPFQAQALAFATWEASVWVDAETYRQEVINGKKPMLPPSEAIKLMPSFPA